MGKRPEAASMAWAVVSAPWFHNGAHSNHSVAAAMRVAMWKKESVVIPPQRLTVSIWKVPGVSSGSSRPGRAGTERGTSNRKDTVAGFNIQVNPPKSGHRAPSLLVLEFGLLAHPKALVVEEKMLGKQNPYTAFTYNNIALMYAYQSEYVRALEWDQKALVINEKVLGMEHPNTVSVRNSIAVLRARL